MTKIQKHCEECGASYEVKPYRAATARFCSQVCGGAWHARTRLNVGPKEHMRGNKLRAGLRPSNAFEASNKPWNKDLKGIHLSPASEYKPGRKSERWLPVGTETVRLDKNGAPRCHVKIAEPNVWQLRAVLVWERENGGKLPEGMVVHHRDRNSLNDDIENLEALTRAEHIAEHRAELLDAKLFIPTPAPKAKQESLL